MYRGRFVCPLYSVGHVREPCKNVEPIEMPFGKLARVGPGNHVLDGGPDFQGKIGNFEGLTPH